MNRFKPGAGALLLGTTVVWGSTFVLAKDVLDFWPPLAYLALRFTLATGAFCLLFPRHVLGARRGEWLLGGLLGLLISGGFALQAVGQITTSPAKSAFLTGFTTPLTPLAAFLLFRERPARQEIIGVVLAFLGSLLMLAPRDESGTQGSASSASGFNSGDLLTLSCTLLFAVHLALIARFTQRVEPLRLCILQIAVATAVFIAAWLGARMLAPALMPAPGNPLATFLWRENQPLLWSARVAWQIGFLATVATVGTFALSTWAQSRLSATRAAVIFSLEPVFATLFAVALRGRGELLTGVGLAGAALVLAGVLVSQSRPEHFALPSRRDTINDAAHDLSDASPHAAPAEAVRSK